MDDEAQGDEEAFSVRSSLSECSAYSRCCSYWTDARSHRGRNPLPQSDSRSAEAGRFPAVMGAGEGQPIGRHTFYSPNEGSAGSGQAALSMSALGDPLRIDTSSQPLTRADCGKAGMLWDEGANVCTESTSSELSLNTPKALVTDTGGGVPDALGESESKSTKRGESLAAVHKPEIAAVESRAKVETAAPRSAKPRPPSRRPPTGRTSLRRRPPPVEACEACQERRVA